MRLVRSVGRHRLLKTPYLTLMRDRHRRCAVSHLRKWQRRRLPRRIGHWLGRVNDLVLRPGATRLRSIVDGMERNDACAGERRTWRQECRCVRHVLGAKQEVAIGDDIFQQGVL